MTTPIIYTFFAFVCRIFFVPNVSLCKLRRLEAEEMDGDKTERERGRSEKL